MLLSVKKKYKVRSESNYNRLYIKKGVLEGHLIAKHNYPKLECPDNNCVKTLNSRLGQYGYIQIGNHARVSFIHYLK
ncbi:unnamed protein product [Cunninghamella echinulata]